MKEEIRLDRDALAREEERKKRERETIAEMSGMPSDEEDEEDQDKTE